MAKSIKFTNNKYISSDAVSVESILKMTGWAPVDSQTNFKIALTDVLVLAGTIVVNDFDNEIFTKKCFIGSVNVRDGTNNVWYYLINIVHRNGFADGSSYVCQIRLDLNGQSNTIQYRRKMINTFSSWKTITAT